MTCSVCGLRPEEVPAPRGWSYKEDAPAYAGECYECAIQDGWIYLDESTMTVLGVPHAEWAPSQEEIAKLAANLRATATRVA